MSRPATDPVRQMLRQRGAAAQAVRGGLDYLVGRWRRTVDEVERLEMADEFDMDEYLNDMDARQLLHDAIAVAGAEAISQYREEIESLDKRFGAATKPVEACIWGARNAAKAKWTRQQNWWYFRLPQGRART